jgi:DNA-binding MarR family transcriptional regulator
VSSERHAEVVAALQAASRISVGQTVRFQGAVAARLGIHPTDLNCLNLLQLHGPLTAGQLAEHAGLTKGGAITAALDRLERAELVVRERDAGDRRRIVVRLRPEAVERVAPMMPGEHWDEMYARYSDDELALVLDFTERSTALLQRLIDRLGQG